jgi:outer membrane lipopolysaccharide assembly protein LptE/RlpB
MRERLHALLLLACLTGLAGCDYPGRTDKLRILDEKIIQREHELKDLHTAETVIKQRSAKKAALEKEIKALKQETAQLEKAKKSK